MPTSTDPAILLKGGGPAVDVERAQEAVRRMRRMQPGLQAFARALTRNPRMDVVISPGNPRTDGERIYLRPPIELGDKTGHEMNLCGQRDDRGIHLCPMHRVLEGVEITLYHEIAHNVYESFEALSDRDKQEIITRRLSEIGTDSATRAGKLAEQLEAAQPGTYLQAAGIVSPYLPMVLNALEDARVNLAMYRARPGTYKMFKAQVVHVFEEGIENADGTISFWSDMPRNAQLVCGLYAKSAGFDYRGWFSDEVVAALDDPALTAELKRVQSARTVKAVYRLGFSVLEHMRRLGFCKRLEDPEDDKLSEDTGEDEQNQQSPEGDKKPDQEPGSPGIPEDDTPPPQPGSPESRDDEENDGQDGDGQESEQDGEADEDASDGADGDEAGQDASDGAEDGQEDGQDASDGDEDGQDDGSEDGADGVDADTGGDSDADGDDEVSDGGQDDTSDEDQDGSGIGDDDDDESESGTNDDDSDGDPETGNSGGGEPGENDVECVSCGEEFDPHQEGQTYNHEAGGPLCGTCEDADEDYDDSDDDDATETADDGTRDSNRSNGAGNEPSSPSIPEDDDVDEGSPEEVERALKVLGGHMEVPENPEDLANQAEIDRAIVQGDFFDEASRKVWGVNVHRHGQHLRNERGFDLSARLAWHDSSGKCWDCAVPPWKINPDCRRAYSHGRDPNGYDVQVDDSIIAASLGRLRVVFSDNRKARKERNLRGGRINARALGRRVPVNDDRLFQKKREPGAKDYFVLIGIDNSGSTDQYTLGIIKAAAMHKAEMLARLGIEFALYAHNGSPHGFSGQFGTASTMDLDIVCIKEPGERWCEQTRQRLRDVGDGGFNLDGHALEFYRKVCDQQRATDKVILYYTDGQMPAANYAEELAVLQREIQTCRRRGYSLVGVGVGTDSPTKHGLDTIRLDTVEDVPLVVKELEHRINQKVKVA